MKKKTEDMEKQLKELKACLVELQRAYQAKTGVAASNDDTNVVKDESSGACGKGEGKKKGAGRVSLSIFQYSYL